MSHTHFTSPNQTRGHDGERLKDPGTMSLCTYATGPHGSRLPRAYQFTRFARQVDCPRCLALLSLHTEILQDNARERAERRANQWWRAQPDADGHNTDASQPEN